MGYISNEKNENDISTTNKFKESFNLAITSYLYIFSKYSGRYFRLNIIFSKLQITKKDATTLL